jgi:hypothetical protein
MLQRQPALLQNLPKEIALQTVAGGVSGESHQNSPLVKRIGGVRGLSAKHYRLALDFDVATGLGQVRHPPQAV